jgi:shikimate dehydrogenase
LNHTHWAIDLIYNPETTAFMKHCINQGATVMNGRYMLQKQAEAAWEIFHQNL